MNQSEILILGAGPCGLGAAWRLKELGFSDFQIIDQADVAGGLARSFVDHEGFTWDIGGHVQFSHYEDFDRVMDLALGDRWLHHQRESWVWIKERFVPYPFQNNLWRLPEEDIEKCIQGLEKVQSENASPKNFEEWILQSFGEGIAEIFLLPYNEKVWAFPPKEMNYQWIGERVAKVDLEKVRKNIELQKDEVSWGPNATFRFPAEGGTGSIWKEVARQIGSDKFNLSTRISEIEPKKRVLRSERGEEFSYEKLVSTIPLHHMAKLCGLKMIQEPLYSHSHIVGIGLKGQVPEQLQTKCWMYFPEDNCPFYRVTVFSNYSPKNVPDSQSQWSLMCETSESTHKPVDADRMIEQTIQGLKATKLISSERDIISRWHFCARPGYPTPFLKRDQWIRQTQNELEAFGIFSRGRFGNWQYEVSNQDHSFMQGFEWAERVLRGKDELTAFDAAAANAPGKRRLHS